MTGPLLLVEDNPDDETLTLRALRKNNMVNEVVVVRDGAEALDFCFARNAHVGRELPQLILLDLNLPKISGLDVLKELRSNDRTSMLPVVILTSSKQEEDIAQSYKNGANAYVRKPVDFGRFVEAVRTVGLFWLLLNESPQGPRAS